jgi:hypothetical protein
VEVGADVRAQTHHVACVRRYLRLIEDQVEHDNATVISVPPSREGG